MTDEKNGIWQGGVTNQSKDEAIREWNKMIRASEDYIDRLDIEEEFNPQNQINKNMDAPSKISGGDPKNRYRSPEGIGKSNDSNE